MSITVNSVHLHCNEIKHVREAISDYFVVLVRNYLRSMLDYIVIQIKKITVKRANLQLIQA